MNQQQHDDLLPPKKIDYFPSMADRQACSATVALNQRGCVKLHPTLIIPRSRDTVSARAAVSAGRPLTKRAVIGRQFKSWNLAPQQQRSAPINGLFLWTFRCPVIGLSNTRSNGQGLFAKVIWLSAAGEVSCGRRRKAARRWRTRCLWREWTRGQESMTTYGLWDPGRDCYHRPYRCATEARKQILAQIVHSLQHLIEAVYPGLENLLERDFHWLCSRAIVSPRNDSVNEINNLIIQRVPGQVKTYKSIDTVTNVDDVVHFPQDFLNSLNPSGLPPHELSLKVGTPIMLLRNISPPNMCNGTILLIKDLKENLIVATILSGPAAGQLANIPRIPMIPTDLPISFKRLQFPLKTSFAITISKSQGQTFSLVGIDLRKECFSHGQLYPDFTNPFNAYIQYSFPPTLEVERRVAIRETLPRASSAPPPLSARQRKGKVISSEMIAVFDILRAKKVAGYRTTLLWRGRGPEKAIRGVGCVHASIGWFLFKLIFQCLISRFKLWKAVNANEQEAGKYEAGRERIKRDDSSRTNAHALPHRSHIDVFTLAVIHPLETAEHLRAGEGSVTYAKDIQIGTREGRTGHKCSFQFAVVISTELGGGGGREHQDTSVVAGEGAFKDGLGREVGKFPNAPLQQGLGLLTLPPASCSRTDESVGGGGGLTFPRTPAHTHTRRQAAKQSVNMSVNYIPEVDLCLDKVLSTPHNAILGRYGARCVSGLSPLRLQVRESMQGGTYRGSEGLGSHGHVWGHDYLPK
ncbi:hypothetical protein PR048_021058 [Dryococelus australis]|uniref:DNA helicase Pif1-like 2B domain-containing protein n=1 Tax=Dryococelus australis TaxID=614101 RepID=A0ABQ9GX57_9NEOP|nr:hypothetical protein PR048_021058 [Dryococelus australis]